MTYYRKGFENIASLPLPPNYYNGTGESFLLDIRNILMFSRRISYELGTKKSLHNRFVLFFNLHKTADIEIALEHTLFKVHPGEYLLLFPHQHHEFVNLTNKEIAVVFVTFESDGAAALSPLRNRIIKLDEETQDAVLKLLNIYLDTGRKRQKNLIVLRTQLLLESILAANDSRSIVSDASIPRQLQDILFIMSRNPAVKINEMAFQSGYSEAYLRRMFRSYFGTTLGQYLVDLKIHKAMSLLSSSRESVTKISELCGYSSVFSFSRAFRSYSGRSPLEYRNLFK